MDATTHTHESAATRILVVDDAPVVRDQVTQAFAVEDAAYEVQAFADATAALRHLDEQPPYRLPDVILLDRDMPGLSGDEALRTLKGSERLRHVPVILLTGMTSSQDMVHGLTVLGAEGYIKKPFDLDEMVAQVKVMVRLKKAEDRQRDLEHGSYLRALEYGLSDPLRVLRRSWTDLNRELRALKRHSGPGAGEVDAALGRMETNLQRMRRFLELELKREPPRDIRRLTVAELTAGLAEVEAGSQAEAEAGEVWVNPMEVREEVLRPLLAGLAPPLAATVRRPGGEIALEVRGGCGTGREAGPDGGDAGGLTLAIAEAIMGRYAGRIQRQQEADGAVAWTFWLPGQAAADIPAGAGAAAQAGAPQPAAAAPPGERTELRKGAPGYAEVVQALRGSRYFSRISPALLDVVLDGSRRLVVAPGTRLIEEGSTETDAIYFLLEGAVDIYAHGRFIVSFTEPGDALGEIGAINRGPRIADAVAAQPSTLVEIDKRALDALRAREPERFIQFLELIALYLGEKVGQATQRLHTYEALVLESRQLRSRSAEMEHEVQDKLRQILLYSHVLESSQDGILIADPEGRVISANPAAEGLLGQREALAGRSLAALFPPLAERLSERGSLGGAALQDGGLKAEWEIHRDEGSPLPVEVTLSPVRQGGRTMAVAVFLRDVSGHKALLASLEHSRNALAAHSQDLEALVSQRTGELKASQQLLQTVVDNVPYAINVKSWDGRYLMLNRSFEELNGVTAAAMLGKGVADIPLRTPEEAGRFAAMDRHVLARGEQVEGPEVALATPDGQDTVQRVIKLPFRDEAGAVTGIITITEDITRQKQIEAELREFNRQLAEANARLHAETDEKARALRQLQETQSHLLQSEKMAALGQLAAGVAHEINNPIGFINSNLHTLVEYFSHLETLLRLYQRLEEALDRTRPEVGDLLGAIVREKGEMDFEFVVEDSPTLIADSLEGAGRVVDIVRNLKEFSHADQAEKQWADLNEGIESTLRLIWNELKYKVTLDKQLGELPRVECYPQQLNQVFLNLLVNAAQAIDERGTITVRTAATDEQVEVEIADTGCGIDPQHLSQIFDPFFTTKPMGKGTGLGLSLVYNIVRKHQGSIAVNSEPGRGTRFTMRLPVQFEDEPQTEDAA